MTTVRGTTLPLTEESCSKLLSEKAQEQKWAPLIDRWLVVTGVDFLESSAIWIWVILNQHEEFAQRKEIRQHVLKIIADAGEDRWVYVHFRTKEEQDELDQGKYDEDEEQDEEQDELEQEKYDVCKES